ncbi:hypothetical protein LEP1GSC058_0471 [Leptospira fainei serovar Hurstbridge str. BUT 6]|uniref:Uncharacterized protein n=1 Tax=Leptospira fainei serovar Hurstbridge str. BUT 6 TaxID=1193011 RepID=S3VHB1_9LEPT|nr:hypothetical protein LEP1GSC058_0471 [Leptospira fainei serovar Hurstbridge str. BUT 6]
MNPANEYIDRYLEENILQSETIRRMRHVIKEFSLRAPKVLVTKCIDGRVHGSKLKGYPATTIRFGRTDGNIVSPSLNNFWFWNRIDRVVNDAACNTPKTPALFIAYMHRSDIPGLGCAAHNGNDEAARGAVREQTAAIRNIFSREQLYVIEGITNTDVMAETLIFEDGTEIDTQALISDFGLSEPTEVFHRSFLKYPIKDPAISQNVDYRTPEELFSGKFAAFFDEYQTSLSMKSFLIREVAAIVSTGEFSTQKLIQPDLLNALLHKLSQVKDLPHSLLAPLLYQTLWNISYSSYQKRKLSRLDAEERWKHLDHAEEIICYGDGFELLQRNKAVLVKTGRGDDTNALSVAKRVLEKNRHKEVKPYPIIVHLNVENSGELRIWEDFNENISSRMNTMLRNVEEVFADQELVILTTYSYRDQKRFYPVHTKIDPRISYPVNVLLGINSEDQFSSIGLKTKEALYSAERIPPVA